MLRCKLLKLAHENSELRIYLIPLLRLHYRKASKSPTEEGAKKLFEEYRDSLKNPGHKTTVRWQDFLEEPPEQPTSEKTPKTKETPKAEKVTIFKSSLFIFRRFF